MPFKRVIVSANTTAAVAATVNTTTTAAAAATVTFIESVAYSSQGSHTGQLTGRLALRSVKSNNVDFLNRTRYLSIK